jgi:hypothetical protein
MLLQETVSRLLSSQSKFLHLNDLLSKRTSARWMLATASRLVQCAMFHSHAAHSSLITCCMLKEFGIRRLSCDRSRFDDKRNCVNCCNCNPSERAKSPSKRRVEYMYRAKERREQSLADLQLCDDSLQLGVDSIGSLRRVDHLQSPFLAI